MFASTLCHDQMFRVCMCLAWSTKTDGHTASTACGWVVGPVFHCGPKLSLWVHNLAGFSGITATGMYARRL